MMTVFQLSKNRLSLRNHYSTKHVDPTVYNLHLAVSKLTVDSTVTCSICPDEIIMHDGVTAVYKSNVDLFFCVLGAQNENEV